VQNVGSCRRIFAVREIVQVSTSAPTLRSRLAALSDDDFAALRLDVERESARRTWLRPRLHRRGWYAIAIDWLAMPRDCRAAVSPQTERQYKAIAELEPEWGRTLDDLRANYRQLRWVADASGPAALPRRRERFDALIEFLRSGKSGEHAFRQLREQHAKVGRAAKRAERARES
jgi:hypothetical protein